MPHGPAGDRSMHADAIHRRLAELGLALPAPPDPVASYVPVVRTGALLVVSGQIPFTEGRGALLATGAVPARASLELATAAARQCALNAIAIVDRELGGELDRVVRVVRLGVFVASTPGFGEQPRIANGASDLLVELFGERGRHARAAVGVSALPLDATVEVEMTVEVA
jgi:enamine deaminase RidA (YjgF/YER057c/UK114 family)